MIKVVQSGAQLFGSHFDINKVINGADGDVSIKRQSKNEWKPRCIVKINMLTW